MQTSFAIAMFLGAAAAHAPVSRNYFATGVNDTDMDDQQVQLKYNEAGLWQYELIQLNEDDAKAAEAKQIAAQKEADAEKAAAAGYDPQYEEYGPTEKVQSLNPIAYQYYYDTNKTGAFRRARTTWY